MGRRLGGPSEGGGSPGAWDRHPTSAHRGPLLRQQSAGGRQSGEIGGGERVGPSSREAYGNQVGRAVEGLFGRPPPAAGGALLPRRMRSSRDGRQVHSRAQSNEMDPRKNGGGLDDQSPGRVRPRKRRSRRVGRAEAERECFGPRDASDSRGQEGSSVVQLRREEEKKEEEGEEEEEGEKGQGVREEKELQREASCGCLLEGPRGDVRRHGPRLKRKGPKEGSQESKEVLEQEEEGQEHFIQQKFKKPELLIDGRGVGRRRSVRRREQSQRHSREMPRALVLREPQGNAEQFAEGKRGRDRERGGEACSHHVLPSRTSTSLVRTHATRNANASDCLGCPSQGPASPSRRHLGPEIEGMRSLPERCSLDSCTTHGGSIFGNYGHSPTAGDSPCPAGELCRTSNSSPGGRGRSKEGRSKRKVRKRRQRRQRKGRKRSSGSGPVEEKGCERQCKGRRQEVTEVEEQCSYNPVSPMASRRDRGGSLGLEVPLGTEEAMVEKGPVNDEYQTLLDPVVEKSTGEERMLPETLLGNGFSSVDSSGPSRLSEGKNGLAFDFAGLTVDRLGPVVEKVLLEGFACVPLRSESMGSRNPMCVFPLPTSRSVLTQCCPDLSDLALCWLSSTILGLNSYWGGDLFCDAGASEIQSSYIRNLAGDVLRLCSIKAKVEHFDWCKFFSNRGVDYQGDEVKVAKSFVWRNISPALPAEVGRVRLEDVCTLGCRHYVQNFDLYLRSQEEWPVIKRPRVMVPDDSWGEVCEGLVKQGVCTFVHRDDVFDCGDGPLLNGLFGVTKDEWSEGFEVYRLIMNLIPLNSLCKGLAGDINTLPSWAGMNPFFMQPEESLLVSSEDVRCFFYILSVPQCWWKYLCFNKRVPDEVLPPELRGEEVYLGSKVLPMGFLNSVSLAQHVHRNLALQVEDSWEGSSPEAELRKDRPFPTCNPLWRVYLDNFDLLEKVKATQVCDLEGSAAPAVLALRGQYEKRGVPRNLKKAVSRSLVAEVQGAIIDGEKGLAYPKEQKLVKYLSSALSLLGQTSVSQREMQVVCGGLVYVSMFRRPLLGTLNSVWKFIEAFESSMVKRLPLPAEVKFELGRFVAMVPMARIDFRLEMDPQVTCSDASCSGGGDMRQQRPHTYGSFSIARSGAWRRSRDFQGSSCPQRRPFRWNRRP